MGCSRGSGSTLCLFSGEVSVEEWGVIVGL